MYKRLVSSLMIVAMVASISGILLVPMPAGAVSVVDGDLIKNPNAEGMAQYDIYIAKVLANGKKFKRLVISPHVFESYEHFDKNGNGTPWDDVVSVDQMTMDAYTTSDLARAIDDTKVYRLSDAAGSDSGTKSWLNMTTTDFDACSFDWDSIYTINAVDRDAYGSGLDIVSGNCDIPADVVSEGTLTVTLAADTPVAGIVVENAARFPFTKVNLTATGGDVVLDQLIVERAGLGQDGAFTSIDVIDASTNLPINATSKTLNSLHQTTFNDNVTIANGTTKTLILAANMPSSLDSYNGETPALAVAGVTVSGDATTNVSLPITGNYMTINSTIVIGTATIQRGSYTNATSTSIQVGKEDYTFLSFQVQAGSTEKVSFSQVKVYQEGSASLGTDVVNLELFQDGTKLADGVITTSKYATFSFDSITLDKGEIGQFQVKADVADGSARTIDLGIYRNTDLIVTGQTYGYNITPTYSGTGSSANNPRLSDNQFTISNGTLQVTRSNVIGAGNIGVSNKQYLGSFEFTAKGEPVNISQLVLTITSGGGTAQIEDALTGLELVNATTGAVVAGPSDITNNLLTVTWSDTFSVPVGTTIYKVRGDLATNGGWASNDTIYVTFTPSAMTATGDTTGNSITATPSTAISGNTQTVKAAALTVTKNSLPADGYTIVNQKDVKLASWHFDASDSGEDVRVTSILWAGRGCAATNTDNFRVFVDGVQYDEAQDNGLSAAATCASYANTGTTTFAFSSPLVITKGTSVDVDLYADKDTVSSDDNEKWSLTDTTASVVARGLTTGNAIVESLTANDGAAITSKTNGTVTAEVEGNPASAILLAGSTGNVFSNVKMSATYEDLRLDQLIVNIGDAGYVFSGGVTATYDDINQVCLYVDGDYITGSASGSCKPASAATVQWDFAADTLTVPEDGSKTIVVKADLSTISKLTDNAPGSNLADINIGFGGTDGIKFTGISSNTEVTGSDEDYRTSTSSDMVLLNSKPVVEFSQSGAPLGAATTLSSNTLNLFNFKVTAEGGDVLLYNVNFSFTTSGDNMTLTNLALKDSDGVTISSATSGTTYGHQYDATSEGYWQVHFNSPTVSLGDYKEVIRVAAGTTETFKLYGTIGGVAANQGESITIRLIGDTASTSSGALFGGDNKADAFVLTTAGDLSTTAGNFVWSDNFRDRSDSGTGANAASTTAQWYNGYLVDGLEDVVSTSPYTISQ